MLLNLPMIYSLFNRVIFANNPRMILKEIILFLFPSKKSLLFYLAGIPYSIFCLSCLFAVSFFCSLLWTLLDFVSLVELSRHGFTNVIGSLWIEFTGKRKLLPTIMYSYYVASEAYRGSVFASRANFCWIYLWSSCFDKILFSSLNCILDCSFVVCI